MDYTKAEFLSILDSFRKHLFSLEIGDAHEIALRKTKLTGDVNEEIVSDREQVKNMLIKYLDALSITLKNLSNDYKDKTIGDINHYIKTNNNLPIEGVKVIFSEEEKIFYGRDDYNLFLLPDYTQISLRIATLISKIDSDSKG